jgi:hypothetical protein
MGVAPSERASVGSSTRLISGDATCSPTRPANSERALMTSSAPSVPATIPSSWAVTHGSRTIVSRPDGGLVAPSMRKARDAASEAAAATSSSSNDRPSEKPKPVWVSSPSAASE